MLALTDVTYSYKTARKPALERINLSLARGARLGLLGVNGAGKSTLVSLLMGLYPPSSGQVLIDNKPAALGRDDIGYVPQDYAFYEQLTIQQNLEYFAAVQYCASGAAAAAKLKKAAIERVINDCDLDAIIKNRAGQCSGGEKRRLNLAIALLRVPSVLILDEPTANVDPHARANIIAIVHKLNQQGVTIVYTSHLLSEVERLCDHLAFIHRGRLVSAGAAETLLSSDVVALNIDAPHLSDAQFSELNAVMKGALKRTRNGCRIDLSALPYSQVSALQKIEALGVSITGMCSERESLEELFFAVTRNDSGDAEGAVSA